MSWLIRIVIGTSFLFSNVASAATLASVKQFLSHTFASGFSQNNAMALGADALPILHELLHSYHEEDIHVLTNAATAVGWLGTDESSIGCLKDFVSAPSRVGPNVVLTELHAKGEAIISLGRILGRVRNAELEGFLRRAARADGADSTSSLWVELIPWSAQSYTQTELRTYLTRRAIQALTISGTPGALEELSSHHCKAARRSNAGNQAARNCKYIDLVSDGIRRIQSSSARLP